MSPSGDIGKVVGHELADLEMAVDAGDHLEIDLRLRQRGAVVSSPLPAMLSCL